MVSIQRARAPRVQPAATRLPGGRSISSAYLVGVCGAGMKALAEVLMGLGCRVTGSDLQSDSPAIRAMQRRGLRIHSGHDNLYVSRDTDVLIYSQAIAENNPERQAAKRLGIPQLSYSEMLGRLMQDRTGVSVAGTHGKSTTTAMAATILGDSHLQASAVIGAELQGESKSGWAGTGDLFVVESCEYRASFLDLSPRFAAILSIEPDHFDCYRSFEAMCTAFSQFARRVEEGGVVLVRQECPVSAKVVKYTSAEVVTFSAKPGADWWATDCRQTAMGTRFRVFFRGEYFSEISLNTPGDHNVMNALAAVALGHHAGATAEEARDGIQSFPGLRRRYESVGSWRGVTMIDDYAHHPTEIVATLKTARRQFGSRRIWCVFQPHQVSRTRALMSQFSESFSYADEVLIAPVFAARERESEETALVSEQLATQIADTGLSARYCPSLDRIRATLEDDVRPGDVMITMGAGDIDRVHHEFTRRLQRHRAAG